MLGFTNTKQLKSDLSYTRKLLEDMREQKATLMQEIAEYRNTISGFAITKEALETEIHTLKSQLSSKTSKHSEEINEFNKKIKSINEVHKMALKLMQDSVNKKVNQTLANIGVSTFLSEPIVNNTITSPKEKLAHFQNLDGTEKTEYYKKHKEDINRAIND